jgi:hypothetical protein
MQKKGAKFKVEIRKNCKVCGGKIVTNRFRTYCSEQCRNKFHYRRSREKMGADAFNRRQREYLYKKRLKLGRELIKCEICGKYFVQICSHVVQTHKMTAREYKKEFGFDVKRGKVPFWYRGLKGSIAKKNGTEINVIEKGKKYWFKKSQKGVGVYERSPETLERLKNLYKKTKKYAKRSLST